MKRLLILIPLFYFSCIPIRIAPTIQTDKVMVASKFKRKLPKKHAFIFEDPKDVNEFYSYINIKYELNDQEVGWDIPFEINETVYYFSFYEVDIPDKTLNILPILVDSALEANNNESIFEDSYVSRMGNWFLVITVTDKDNKDCLHPDYIQKEVILEYLRKMRVEYLNTSNYLDALLKK